MFTGFGFVLGGFYTVHEGIEILKEDRKEFYRDPSNQGKSWLAHIKETNINNHNHQYTHNESSASCNPIVCGPALDVGTPETPSVGDNPGREDQPLLVSDREEPSLNQDTTTNDVSGKKIPLIGNRYYNTVFNCKNKYILLFNEKKYLNRMIHKNNLKLNVPLLAQLIGSGVEVPHYCYHDNLSIAGNCRVCLVELKGSPKPVVSCSVSRGSGAIGDEVSCESALVKKARENILEFLLLNHPLDCPICDQGGECDLQDQSLHFGLSRRRFYRFKRIVRDKNLGPIVRTVMTRCIHCTRCIRFANEIAGIEELGVFTRGNFSEVGTYVDKVMLSELSGNVIDLCPVGGITLHNYKYILIQKVKN